MDLKNNNIMLELGSKTLKLIDNHPDFIVDIALKLGLKSAIIENYFNFESMIPDKEYRFGHLGIIKNETKSKISFTYVILGKKTLNITPLELIKGLENYAIDYFKIYVDKSELSDKKESYNTLNLGLLITKLPPYLRHKIGDIKYKESLIHITFIDHKGDSITIGFDDKNRYSYFSNNSNISNSNVSAYNTTHWKAVESDDTINEIAVIIYNFYNA